KQDRHPDVHCFPSSVDADHFGQALSVAEPDEQASLPGPKLGFFGVIDERLDINLIDRLAQAHPDWQIIMVGPTVKIDPATLPRHGNIHYFGQQPYERLPSFLAGWDVCLLPFAMNRATRFISPTKTLEYMAAERMIVSTPIRDVAEPYGHVVYLASTARDFVAQCETALEASETERRKRLDRMAEVLSGTSWASTVKKMDDLVSRAIDRKAAIASDEDDAALKYPKAAAAESSAPQAPVVVIGAGPTGLSTAYHLEAETRVIEAEASIGGHCRSIKEAGFTFDHAGHIMFSKDPYVHEMYETLLGTNVHWQNREAWIHSKGVHTRYPFQGCLY
ncbi:MAG: NAD(P)-binding protein, partial [Phycisphaeraceae bacterium]